MAVVVDFLFPLVQIVDFKFSTKELEKAKTGRRRRQSVCDVLFYATYWRSRDRGLCAQMAASNFNAYSSSILDLSGETSLVPETGRSESDIVLGSPLTVGMNRREGLWRKRQCREARINSRWEVAYSPILKFPPALDSSKTTCDWVLLVL
jgi:hypothetical protein